MKRTKNEGKEMARLQKKRERDTNGAGSIAKLKDGRFQYWYYDPTSGKRKAKILTKPDETGREVPVTNIKDANEVATIFRQEISELASLKEKEHAQVEIAKTRKLIAGLTTTPADIWPKFLEAPTRPQDASEARQRDQKLVIDRLVDWCGQQIPPITTMNDITAEVLSKFLTNIYGDLSGRSYDGALTIMRHVFKHTYKSLGLEANPAEVLEGRTVKTNSRKEFTAEQVQAIIKGFDDGFFYETEVVRMTTGRKHERVVKRLEYKPDYPEQFRLLILLMTFTGCRCGDACNMPWEAVNIVTNTIKFMPHKTAHSSGVVVSLPLHQMLRDGLIKAQEWKRDGYILPDVAQRYSYNRTGIYKTIQKIVACATGLEITMSGEESNEDEENKKAQDGKKDKAIKAKARNAAQYGAHSFRHSFVSFCASAGVPLAVVQQIVGHGSPAMIEHYFNASRDAKQAAIEALPDMGANVDTKLKDITPDALRMQIATFVNQADLSDLQTVWHFIEELQKSYPKLDVEPPQH